MLENISENAKALFLRDLMQSYVGQQGLGSMPKADLDALIIHLYLKYSGTQKVDVFALSETFKIKESRVKSLVETGWIKFSGKDEVEVWLDIISSLSRVSIELESLEKGQVRFKLENPAHFRYFQKQVRLLESTASYSPSSEQVVTQFDVFNKVINRVYQFVLTDSQAEANDAIKAIYRRIRNDIIGPERFESYRTGEQKQSVLGKSLSKAAELSGIASLVISVFGSNPVSAAVALKAMK